VFPNFAAGILSLLEEPMAELRTFALRKLMAPYDKHAAVIDVFWPEISESIGTIELLYEDEKFPERSLAALVASKVSSSCRTILGGLS